MGVLLLLLASQPIALASAPPTVRPNMSCRLVAANGAILGFELHAHMNRGSMHVQLEPAPGSSWPKKASKYVDPTSSRIERSKYKIRDREFSGILSLGRAYPDKDRLEVELSQDAGGETGLPLAQGYCSDKPAAPLKSVRPGAKTEVEGSFSDISLWREGCYVLARDGRRSSIRYTTPDAHSARIEPLDDFIWPVGVPIDLPRISPPSAPSRRGIVLGFATGGGGNVPRVREMFYGDVNQKVGVLRLVFDDLKSRSASPPDEGYGTCVLRLRDK